jgi:multiple sugar transport system ATP-binding protein
MVTVRAGGALISIKADKTFRAEIGDPIVGSIPASICHLFDTKTGNRLDAKG